MRPYVSVVVCLVSCLSVYTTWCLRSGSSSQLVDNAILLESVSDGDEKRIRNALSDLTQPTLVRKVQLAEEHKNNLVRNFTYDELIRISPASNARALARQTDFDAIIYGQRWAQVDHLLLLRPAVQMFLRGIRKASEHGYSESYALVGFGVGQGQARYEMKAGLDHLYHFLVRAGGLTKANRRYIGYLIAGMIAGAKDFDSLSKLYSWLDSSEFRVGDMLAEFTGDDFLNDSDDGFLRNVSVRTLTAYALARCASIDPVKTRKWAYGVREYMPPYYWEIVEFGDEKHKQKMNRAQRMLAETRDDQVAWAQRCQSVAYDEGLIPFPE